MSQSSVQSQIAPPRLHFRVPPEPSHLLRARERIRDYLRQYCADGQIIEEVVVCVEEAATNAIRHSGADADIEISLRFADGNLAAEVKDQGRGFDVTAFDRAALPAPLSDHGRGLFLISRICDQVELRMDGGLEVRMVKTAVAPCQAVSLESGVADLQTAGDLSHRDLRLRALLEEIDEGFFAFDWECRYVHANATGLRLTGKALQELLGHTPWELFPLLDGTALQASYRRALELGTPAVLEHRSVVSGDWLEVRIYPTPAGVSAYYRQINERKRAELERETANGFLRLINESDSLVDLVQGATTFFQQQSGCEAVGIRLREGDDYPYFEARGLPAEFVALENELCARDGAGQICRDKAGYPIMECMCGNVICGRIDPAQKFFSERGSFWTNNTTELLETSSEEDRQARTRNRCNGEGYESVALIALNVGAERLGLLQLNDRRSGRFTPEDIALWERLADQLAVAISKLRLEGELLESRQSERFLADVIEQAEMPFGVGAPDGRLIFFNQAFADLTGYSRAELEERALTWVTDLTPQQWRASEAELLAQAVGSRQAVRYEKEYRRKDGSLVPIELLVQPVFDQAGDLLHYRSFVTDISVRKQAERALLEHETEAARLDEELPGSRATRLLDRFRGRRWSVLAGAIALQSAILAALNTAPDTRHVLGLPGSMIALVCVVAGALAGPLVGTLVAIAGGGVFYLTVGGRGSHSTVLTIMVSTAIWVTAGLLSGFLARTLSEQAERRRAAAVALVRADAAREAQLAEQARIEELVAHLQVQTENLQAAGEELSAQRDELRSQNKELSAQRDELVERAMRMSLLKALAEVGASSLGSKETAQRQVEALARTLKARTVFLFAVDDAGEHLVPLALAGVTEAYLEQHAGPIEVAGDGASARVFRSRQASFIRDVTSDATLSESGRAFTLSLGQHSGASLPLIASDEAIGCLAIAWVEPRSLDADEISFLESLASEVALGLANARLLERERAAAMLNAALAKIDEAIHSTLDFTEVVQTALREGAAVIGAETAGISMHDDEAERFRVAYIHNYPPDRLGVLIPDRDDTHGVEAMRTGQTVAIDDTHADPRVVAELMEAWNIQSVICAPLVVQGHPIAVVYYNYHTTAHHFSQLEEDFVTRLASSLSLALENARLYEAQLNIATTLQENFVHELPTVPGLELGVVAKTAYEPELVGGDFSDVFVVDDTRVVVLIGDVAGKGVRAAGLTETVRSTVRALAAIEPSPAFILARTNELLLKFDPDEPHVTAFCAILDSRTGHLTYASAGHPAPVRLSPFTCLPLEVTFGPPLGSFELPYRESHATLTIEDYLVLYTDGVTEARRDGDLLGERRLAEIVAGLRGQSAQKVAEGVRDVAADFAGGRLSDDLQVVVVRLA